MKKNSSDTQEPQAAASRTEEETQKRQARDALTQCGDHILQRNRPPECHSPQGDEPYIEGQPWLELRGTAQEPVKGVTDVKISMWPREKVEIGTARPASVGSVLAHVRNSPSA